jgi:hypothetical protein
MTRALMQYQPRGVGDVWFGGSQCSTMGAYGPFVFLNTNAETRYALLFAPISDLLENQHECPLRAELIKTMHGIDRAELK